ncbi:MAG: hypothetical protein ACFFDF_03720 [Candidatus Odinarchaeota archaeon]
MKIGDLVPRKQFENVQKIVSNQRNIINKQKNEINYTYSILIKAKGILDAPFTESNILNVVTMLESLPNKEKMQRFVNKWILKSAKKPNAYCKMVKEKCEKENRYYGGFNKKYYTFNYVPYKFVFNVFKDKAIRKTPTSFSFRFRDALISFILNEIKYTKK